MKEVNAVAHCLNHVDLERLIELEKKEDVSNIRDTKGEKKENLLLWFLSPSLFTDRRP